MLSELLFYLKGTWKTFSYNLLDDTNFSENPRVCNVVCMVSYSQAERDWALLF